MNSLEVLVEVVVSFKGKSPNGISCYYIQLNDSLGIKVFHNKYERDTAFQKQKLAALDGYGPEVGIIFDIQNKYCYTTQHAQTLVDCIGGFTAADEREARRKFPGLDEKISKLLTETTGKEYQSFDNHYGNFGFIGEKLVLIDFGTW